MKIKIKDLIKTEIFRYIIISIISYVYVFFTLILFVNVFKVNESLSFMIVYGIAYLFLYSIQLKFLFKTEHDKYKLIRFCISLLFFYVIANILYNICIYFSINYIISTAITIIVLFPIRFIVSKYFVYK